MKNIFLFAALAFSTSISSQSFIQTYQDRVNQVTQTNINTSLTEFASFGVKKTGSVANSNALTWLKNKYLSYGYSSAEIMEDPWTGGGFNSKNLVVTKTGTLYPNQFVIVCAHFDTIAGPGVNDNGSGTSILLEMARVLKDVPTEYSIKFINFSGEEQGLYGSRHYVSNVVNSTNPKMNIKVVFNIDQVGGVAGQVNNTVFCDRDQSSPISNNAASAEITQQLANCTTLYSSLLTDFDPAYASDYVPFQLNGEIITGFYEHNISSYPHTPNDTYVNMDPVYVYNVGKAAIGAVQHFSVAKTSGQLGVADTDKSLKSQVSLYPNPAQDLVNTGVEGKGFQTSITDFSGKIILQSADEQILNVSKIPNGNYLLTVSRAGESVTKKLMIKK